MNNAVFRKVTSLALLITGILVMAVSFLYYAGTALPYPDPTAELLAQQTAEAKKWSLLFTVGFLATLFGGAWLWAHFRSRKPVND